MKSTLWTSIDKRVALAVLVTGLLSAPAVFSQAAATKPAQQGFATPDAAAKALIQAAEDFDVAALQQMLGADAKDLISSGDSIEDKTNTVAFATAAKEKLSVA